MALDLTGITNENEFYSHHYLTAILETDLRALVASWAQMATPPYEALKALAPKLANLAREKDKEDKVAASRQFYRDLLASLGYAPVDDTYEFGDGTVLPLVAQINRSDGRRELWAIELKESDDEDQLDSLEECLSKQIFEMDEPPRWVLVWQGLQLLLIDRTKWPQKRLLRFRFDEILSRKEPTTLRATAALLHRESVCPENQVPLLDTLDENSHRHAFAVSADLKYAAREAVELIANEAVWYLGQVLKEGKYDKGLAQQLTRESLRYLYRLLFLFYIEARDKELGYAPMQSDEYRTGYSLEALREVAEREIEDEEEGNGYFFDDSLKVLFSLVHDGHLASIAEEKVGDHSFQMEPLRSNLFDPSNTPTLRRVRLRNFVLREVIDLLSYSRRGRHKRRGRISYAQLGINQLGAVYEGLLSYTGFFVETDGGLYEVKPAGDEYDRLKQAFFVPLSALAQYKEDEKVFDSNGKLVHHPKGKFVYRLSGRERKKSASYYTPEVLTQCVVKYSLKELLAGKSADDILALTICEPAMGSGAFLNESVNQLADAYLERKQKDTGRTVPFDSYQLEKQRVKAYLADNRVFGVDLNPIAIELAEVSLWLNTIYEGHTIPWFGGQLVCGNSLVGARRQAFATSDLVSENRRWLDSVPDAVAMNTPRQPGQIWHFLVPDNGMGDYADKTVRAIWPDEIKAFRDWRRNFTRRFDGTEIAALERLSTAAEKLWHRHAKDMSEVRRLTAHIFPVFGQEENPAFEEHGNKLTTSDRDRVYAERITPRDGPASAYQRLKLAMDYWCALWHWPLANVSHLPTRAEYFAELSAILEGTSSDVRPILGAEQLRLMAEADPQQMQLTTAELLGSVEMNILREKHPRLNLIEQIAELNRFLHWHLEFADLFLDRSGFDLILGNPPWVRMEWNAGSVLGDFEPLNVIRGATAPTLRPLIAPARDKYPGFNETFLREFVEIEGGQKFLNAKQNYPILIGSQSNTYKCFLAQSWQFTSAGGVQGFLHPEGVYDDPNGGRLRAFLYPRLRGHFQFINELKLFEDVDHHTKYSVNISGAPSIPEFLNIANLFHPSTIDSSLVHGGKGVCGGIKDDKNKWNVAGHLDRIIEVNEETLALFAKLYDKPGTPRLEARMSSVHSRKLLSVLHKFAEYPTRLGDWEGKYDSTVMWDETNRVNDGTIRRETRFPSSPKEWILSGPHIDVGNALSKTPRAVCVLNSDYDPVDLTELPDDYLPRTNYVAACSTEDYTARAPRVSWNSERSTAEFYRLVNREMTGTTAERTLILGVIPPGPGHVHTVFSLVFADLLRMLDYLCMAISLPVDFRVKSTGMGHANKTLMEQLPVLGASTFTQSLQARALMLTCVTAQYGTLWQHCWRNEFSAEQWTKPDQRLPSAHYASLQSKWTWETPLRTDFERRQALVEIDVLVAREMKLTLDELCSIYRIQFPVFRHYENNTYYDQKGRIIYLAGQQAFGLSTQHWKEVANLTSGVVTKTIIDDTLPGGPRERVIEYHAPFDKFDREADYAEAWKFFDEAGE